MARPRISEQRRREILEAAATVIAERGLCDTRIADVAALIGASPALILYHFKTKDALLAAALVYRDQVFFEEISARLATAPTAGERLRILIDTSCPPEDRLARSEWALWLDLWTRARHDETLAEARSHMDRLLRAAISEVVVWGIERGEFTHPDPARFAILLSSLIDGLAIQVLLDDKDVTRQVMLDLCLDLAARELGGGD